MPRSHPAVRSAPFVGVLVAVGLVLGACAESELTHEEYVTRADAICAEANEQISALAAPSAADREGVAATMEAVVEVQRDEVSSLEELVPARDDRDLVREWLEGVRAALDDSELAASALRADDIEAAQRALGEARAAAAMADERARALGLRVCVVQNEASPVVGS